MPHGIRTEIRLPKFCLFQTRQRGSKLPRGDILPVTTRKRSTGLQVSLRLLVVFHFFELGVDSVVSLGRLVSRLGR